MGARYQVRCQMGTSLVTLLLLSVTWLSSNVSHATVTDEEEYPFGFWYDGELMTQLRSDRSPRIPRTTRNSAENDRSLLLKAISNIGDKGKRENDPNTSNTNYHHQILSEMLTKWRF